MASSEQETEVDAARTLTVEERLLAALVEYDGALCSHAGMIARRERFTRRDGWGEVDRLRDKYDLPALIAEVQASAPSPERSV